MLKRLLFFTLTILIVILITILLIIPERVRYSDYAYLKNPRFVMLPAIKALQVKTTGNPAATVLPAIRLLHKTYRKLDGVNPQPDYHMPIARWYFDSLNSASDWEVRIIIPVPDSVEDIPVIKDDSGLTVELTCWKYGEVAEILHVGPYEMKVNTRKILKKFIDEQGYIITGPLEEQYVKGPERFSFNNPRDYLTIIRYQVKRK